MRSYYVMRHGESEANVAGLISSDPAISTKIHGLTELGREQAKRKGSKLIEEISYADRIYIYHSDFTRARQTAEIVKGLVEESYPGKLQFFGPEIRIRERHFGSLNGQSDDLYDLCWQHDEDLEKSDPPPHDVESCSAVLERGTSVITDHEEQYKTLPGNEVVIMVCHGDVAQILTTGHYFKENPRMHRVTVIPPFDKADWRKIKEIQ